MGRSWPWFVGAMLCLSCGGAPPRESKATVEVASAPAKADASGAAQAKRSASQDIKRYWVLGERPQAAIYADLQGLVRTRSLLSLLRDFLAHPELQITPAQHDCVNDALSSVRELAFGNAGGETLAILRFEPATMRTSPAACLRGVTGVTPDSITKLLGVEAYELDAHNLLAIRDGVLLYGSRPLMIEALRPDRTATIWPPALELSSEQYLAFSLDNPTVDGNPYAQVLSTVTGGLFVMPNRLRLEFRMELFEEERAAALEKHVRQNLESLRSRAPFPGAERLLDGATVERNGRQLLSAVEITGTPAEQAAQLGLLGSVVASGVRRYLRHAKQAEARNTLAVIAQDYADTWRAAPLARKQRKLWSLPAVPTTIPSGTKHQSLPNDWKAWNAIHFTMGDPQYYQYEVVAAPDGLSAEVIARGDLDGNGTASRFSLRLELQAGEVSIAPAIDEKDPEE